MRKRFRTNVRDIAGDFFRAQFGIAGVHGKFVQVDRGKHIFFYQAAGNQDGVFVVIPFPAHKAYQHVAAQRQIAVIHGRAIAQHLPLHHFIAGKYNRALVDAGILVGAFIFQKFIYIIGTVFGLHDNFGSVGKLHHAVAFSNHGGTGVAGDFVFNTGTHIRGFGNEQRHTLALHVAAHQGAVGVVVFQERN